MTDQGYPRPRISRKYLIGSTVRAILTRVEADLDWPSFKKVPAWPEEMPGRKEPRKAPDFGSRCGFRSVFNGLMVNLLKRGGFAPYRCSYDPTMIRRSD